MRKMSFRGLTGGAAKTTSQNRPVVISRDDVYKEGQLRKLKTGKRKYFVIRSESESGGAARLEYYDSEKKWRSGLVGPKRSITLKTCFNINRRADAKQRPLISLYTSDDCFTVWADNEQERDEWLNALLELQNGTADGDSKPRPNFEHVWEVNVNTKGLGSSRNITGQRRLCLTNRALSLVKMSVPEEDPERCLEFPLFIIRRCGHSDCFFFMELGRSAVTGSGELWMQTEDTLIAQNMHEAILNAMKQSKQHASENDLPRPRSSSTSEAAGTSSKPISMRVTTSKRCDDSAALGATNSQEPMTSHVPLQQLQQQQSLHHHHNNHHHPLGATAAPPLPIPRDRCDSMPSQSYVSRYSTDPTSRHYTMDSMSQRPSDISRYRMTAPMSVAGSPSSSNRSLEGGKMSSLDENVPPPTIKEEDVQEYMTMNSPAGNIGVEDYMKMSSPLSVATVTTVSTSATAAISPPHNDSSYVSMSPINCNVNNVESGYIPMDPIKNMSCPPSSLGSNGSQSMYCQMSMTPPMSSPVSGGDAGTSVGYLPMAPLSSSLPKSVSDFSNSWCSSAHSLQDISPLEVSLEGFHLDKVKSFFPPSASDEDNSSIRPVRAYSVGKRPQLNTGDRFASLGATTSGHAHNNMAAVSGAISGVGGDAGISATSRVRAYSVGSQAPAAAAAALRRKRQLQQQKQNSADGTKSNAASGVTSSSSKIDTAHRSKYKSSSTPQLPGGAIGAGSLTQQQQQRREEHLMEINYESSSRRRPSNGSIESDYVPMNCANSSILTGVVVTPTACHLEEKSKLPPVKEQRLPVLENGGGISSSNGHHQLFPVVEVTPEVSSSRRDSDKDCDTVASGEYVNLDLSKTWQYSTHIQTVQQQQQQQHNNSFPSVVVDGVSPPVGANVASTPMVSAVSPQSPQVNYENVDLTLPLDGAKVGENGGVVLPPSSSAATGVEYQLNYASLDLKTNDDPSIQPRSPRTPKNNTPEAASSSCADECTSSSYAKIDFELSEGLRNTSKNQSRC